MSYDWNLSYSTGEIIKIESGHGGAAGLLPGFATNWEQHPVTRQPHLHDPTHLDNYEIGGV